MKNLIKMMVLAGSVSTMVLAPSNALADETNIANQWMVVDDYKFIKDGIEKTQVSLVEIVPEGVVGWVFKINNNGVLGYDQRSDFRQTGEHTDVDLSMLDGSEGSILNLTKIDASLFQNITTVTSVKLPSTVTQIGQWSFTGCSNLTNSFDLSNITTLGHTAFQNSPITGEVYMEKFIGTMGTKNFRGTKITRVEMPYVTKLEGEVFQDCKDLATVILPAVTYIGGSCFKNCTSLVGKIAFPKVLTIEGGVFCGANNITCIELPQTTKIGGNSCFSGSSVVRIIVPSVESFTGSQTFRGLGSQLKGFKLPWCMGKFESGKEPFNYYNNGALTVFIHNESILAEDDDDTIKLSGCGERYTRFIKLKRYGGSTSANESEWVYDNALWNADTTNYVRQASVVTLVAAKSLSIVGDEVQIPKKLPIEVLVDLEDGDPETVSANSRVTAIEACAFKKNENLVGKTVRIPNSITRIGVAAFPQGCYMKVKQSAHAKTLVDQLNLEYGQDDSGKPYASIDNAAGFVIIVK